MKIKIFVFIISLVPLALLVHQFFFGDLGPNPVETLSHKTGEWGLRFLLLTLSCTPLRLLIKQSWPIRFRRMLGLYAFFYICLHFLVFLLFDLEFDFSAVWKEILERPYITVGFLAWLLMVPLAITSTNKMLKRLGKKWKPLHRLVYGVAVLGMLHFFWIQKAGYTEVLIYAALFAADFVIRWLPDFHGVRVNLAKAKRNDERKN